MLALIGSLITIQALELSQFTFSWISHLELIGFFATQLVLPFWFWIIAEYESGQTKLPFWILLLFVEPTILILAHFTNDLHGLMYVKSSATDESNFDRLLHVEGNRGLLMQFNPVYLFSVGSICFASTIRAIYKNSHTKAVDITLVALSLGLPMLTVTLYRFGFIPVSVAPAFMILFLYWSVSQYRLLDILPIAREQLVDRVHAGVVVLNAQHQLVLANAVAKKQLNIELEDTNRINQPLLLPDIIESHFDLMQPGFQQKDIVLPIQQPSGKVEDRFLDIQLSPIAKSDQESMGHLLLIWDISERKQSEIQREYYLSELQTSWQKLKEVEAMKSDFFAGISHEFRTPLTLSLGQLEDLYQDLHGPLSEAVKERLTNVADQNRRLLALVNQLLDISRSDTADIPISPSYINLTEHLPKLIANFTPLASKQSLTLNFHSHPKRSWVFFDPEALHKVIDNLLSNAIKNTMESGRVDVLIEENHQAWIVSISDNGVGILQENIDKVFDRFFSTQAQKGLLQPGIGIGLSLVKSLVELHHGEITVSSEPGIGTRFTLHLLKGVDHLGKFAHVGLPEPQGEDIPAELGLFENNASTKSDTTEPDIQGGDFDHESKPTPTDTKVILVVEDNAQMREYIRFHLGSRYRLLEAQDGEEGLDLAQDYVPDLIVCDIMMPKVNGYDFCQSIKTTDSTSHIPVILLTAKNQIESRLFGLRMGADDYINKPFSMEELKVRIHNLIATRHQLKSYYQQALLSRNPIQVELPSRETAFMKKLVELMDTRFTDPAFSIDDLADAMHMSTRALQRKLKSMTGQTPKQILISKRLKCATDLLTKSDLSIGQISDQTGFTDSSYFSRLFKLNHRISPKEYRESRT